MRIGFRRPSPALIVSIVALVAALAGSALALPGKNSVTSNDIKKNSVKSKTVKDKSLLGKDVKDDSITGADVDESSLGDVPSVTSSKLFSVGANENSITSLVSTPDYELMGVCDEDDSFAIPGATATLEDSDQTPGTTMIIVNRGTSPVFAESDDDDDYKLETNEGVAFNYQDNGDGGGVISPSGSFMMVPSWSNVLFDSSYVDQPNADDDPTGFATNCHFAGAAFVG